MSQGGSKSWLLHEPRAKSIQATHTAPSGVMTAVGKLLARNPANAVVANFGSPFLRKNSPGLGRPEAIGAGALQLFPPSFDFANFMLSRSNPSNSE